MAIQYNAAIAETVYIDPADPRGPWTILFPDPDALLDAAWFRIVPISASITPVTLDGNGKDIRRADAGSSAPLFQTRLDAGTVYFQFNEGRDEWFPVGGFSYDARFAPALYSGSGPLAIGTATQLPLSFLAGDDERFSIVAGDLVANLAIPWVSFEARVLHAMNASANNQELQLDQRFSITRGGSGVDLAIPAAFPFQTSRDGDFDVSLACSAFHTSLLAGDAVRLEASVVSGDMTNQATSWLVEATEGPRFPLIP